MTPALLSLAARADAATADDHADALARIVVDAEGCPQPPLAAFGAGTLTAILPSLALGGAERIVLDWAVRERRRREVHVVALGAAAHEYSVPAGVRVTRLEGDVARGLHTLGRALAASIQPACLCHLLTAAQRAVLRDAGALPLPVVHNARAGWIDAPAALRDEPHLVAVSDACAADLRAAGCRGAISVIRHIPRPLAIDAAARAAWRSAWSVPSDALLVGMMGGVKPQKAYPRALRVLAALQARRPDARLVILGGPVGRQGSVAWDALVAQRERLGLQSSVTLAGFVPDAARALAAFDVVLNTSRYEGFSMATLEALVSGVPVVAAAVGGQGEIPPHDGLRLVPFEADEARWADALAGAAGAPRAAPEWLGFPSYRLWSLVQQAVPYRAGRHVLFATANLNAGGAQRSLVHLARALQPLRSITVAVNGNSTRAALTRELGEAGVETLRTAATRDAFDHAEGLLRLARERRTGTLVFWNVDPKVKLLVAKAAAALPDLRLVDVSPGGYADEEMAQTEAFQRLVAYREIDYRRRLDCAVTKHGGWVQRFFEPRAPVIPNGVPLLPVARRAAGTQRSRVVMSGRIAPSKFLVEAIAAMRLVRERVPNAELHVLGGAEPRHAAYARAALDAAGSEAGRSVFFHGPRDAAPAELADFDVALVLGAHQGCPNACLEAFAAGLPVVANDSGGTREQVVHGRTGWLLRDVAPGTVAAALIEALTQPALARRRGAAGRRRVARRFSLPRMRDRYLRLFARLEARR